MASSADVLLPTQVAASAQHLHRLLTSAPSVSPFIEQSNWFVVLERDIIRCCAGDFSREDLKALELASADLWDVAAIILKPENATIANEQNFPRVRAIALWGLIIATPKTATDDAKILKDAFQVIRSCLDVSLLSVASKILQGCVPRLLDLKSRTPSSEQGQIDMIVASKKMLEIRLLLLQGYVSHAEKKYLSASVLGNPLVNRETVIGTCYDAGLYTLEKSPNVAIIWFRRAIQQVELSLSKDDIRCENIRLLEIQCRDKLIRTYLASEPFAKRMEIVEEQMTILRAKYRDSLAVKYLELETACHQELGLGNQGKFLEALNSIMDNHGMAEYLCNRVSNYMKVLSKACHFPVIVKACQSILSKLPETRAAHIGEVFFRLVELSASYNPKAGLSQSCYAFIVRDATQILDNRPNLSIAQPIIEATVQIIWDRVMKEIEAGSKYAEEWCHLLLHRKLFEPLSNSIQLTIIMKYVCIAQSSPTKHSDKRVHEAVEKMMKLPGADSDEQVLFLRFRQALRDGDDLSKAIGPYAIRKLPNKVQFLEFCTMEAHRDSNSDEVLPCLERYLSEAIDTPSTGSDKQTISTNAYLFSIDILSRELEVDRDSNPKKTMMVNLLAHLKRGMLTESPFDMSDTEWLIRKGLNLAFDLLKDARDADNEGIVNIVTSMEYLIQYRTHIEDQNLMPRDLSFIMLKCYFCGVFHLRLFHLSTDDDERRMLYEHMIITAWSLLRLPDPMFPYPHGLVDIPKHLVRMAQDLGVCTLQCAIAMKDWDEDTGFTSKVDIFAWSDGDHGHWDRILELVLATHEHPIPKFQKVVFIQDLFHFTFEDLSLLDDSESVHLRSRLPRWLRIYFDILMSDDTPELNEAGELLFERKQNHEERAPEYIRSAEAVLDQALALLEDEAHINSAAHQATHITEDINPETGQPIITKCSRMGFSQWELVPLAAGAWRHSRRFLAAGKTDLSERWHRKALKLADSMEDKQVWRIMREVEARSASTPWYPPLPRLG